MEQAALGDQHRTSQTGDFEAFFDSTYPRLAKGMYLLTGSHQDAEDIAQEAMARVFERWDRVRAMASPDGYATTVALNLWRRRSRVRRDPPPAADRRPLDPAAEAETHDELRRVLRTLSREQREAAVVVWWLGYTAQEAASLLGIDATSVRGRLHRARNALSAAMGGNDG